MTFQGTCIPTVPQADERKMYIHCPIGKRKGGEGGGGGGPDTSGYPDVSEYMYVHCPIGTRKKTTRYCGAHVYTLFHRHTKRPHLHPLFRDTCIATVTKAHERKPRYFGAHVLLYPLSNRHTKGKTPVNSAYIIIANLIECAIKVSLTFIYSRFLYFIIIIFFKIELSYSDM